MNGADQRPDPADGERTGLELSRRGLLAASGMAVAGAAGREALDATVDPALADVTVRAADLVGQDAYVEWHVEAADADLTRYLRRTVGSFDGAGGVASGFVSDGTATLPKYVESAVFPAAGEWAALVDATATWVDATHDTPPTVDRRENDRVAWRAATDDGLVDAVRLDRVDDLVTVTVAGGSTAGFGPESAVRRYGRTVRGRAGLR